MHQAGERDEGRKCGGDEEAILSGAVEGVGEWLRMETSPRFSAGDKLL